MLLLLLANLGFPGSSAAAQPTTVDNAISVAKKDYVSAQTKILQDYKHAVDQCLKWTGPAEKACTTQAQATRDAAEEDAKATVDRAGYTVPLPDKDRQKVSDGARVKAKDDYKALTEKVMQADRVATMECSRLRGPDRKTCTTGVAARTADAKRRAKYNYSREIDRAKAMAAP